MAESKAATTVEAGAAAEGVAAGGADGVPLRGHHASSASNCSPSASVMDAVPVKRIAVLGAGSYGTAMATVAARNGHEVRLYTRDEEQMRCINEEHRNSKYLTEFTLAENIRAVCSVAEAVQDAHFVIHAIPAQATPRFLAENKDVIPPDMLLCSTSKGLYLPTKQLLSDAMIDALGREQPMAFLSGPSFAKELMQGHPTAVVVASRLLFHAVMVQRAMSSLSFRAYTTQDTVGVELGGALKNPLAIGAGVIEGLGLGINTMAGYVTRSCSELQRLCVAMGGDAQTISGLSGIGDLMLTAFGSLSRNRTFGMRLAKGEKSEDITKEFTVEGIPTAQVAVYYADLCGLDLPIFHAVHRLLTGELAIQDVHTELMGRPLTAEHPTQT